MAEDVTATESRAERARRTAYRSRFILVYFALAVVAGSAVGAAIVVFSRPSRSAPEAWSAFVPTGTPSEKLFQISQAIPKRYQNAAGEELVAADVASPQEVIDSGGTPVYVPVDRVQLVQGGGQQTIAGAGIQFTLCGSANNNCMLAGTPSTARYYVLQREALELSLYALHYVKELDSVTVLMPPSVNLKDKTKAPLDTAVFLQRKDVAAQIAGPLALTLEEKITRPTTLTKADEQAVLSISRPRTFTYSLTRAPDGTFVRVMQPAT